MWACRSGEDRYVRNVKAAGSIPAESTDFEIDLKNDALHLNNFVTWYNYMKKQERTMHKLSPKNKDHEFDLRLIDKILDQKHDVLVKLR